MKNKFLNLLFKYLIPLAFWLSLWQIAAMIIDHSFLLPGIPETLSALGKLLFKPSFYKVIILSAGRVIFGLLFGIGVGTSLALLCNRFEIIKHIFLPIIRIIKSTPVASFIVVLWVLMSGDALSIFIGFLMVMPIIFQNVTDGLSSIDKGLLEVAQIFEFSRAKRFKLLTLPAIRNYLSPAIITASGLCWKAVIAAEIIAYTKQSIGQMINDAKYNSDSPTIFAWTVVIIVLSIALEKIAEILMRRDEK